ncbi:MAG: glycosyltransferase family 2 protein [Planctomycetota bacterium]|jgi:GT2 family glycosyltransferase
MVDVSIIIVSWNTRDILYGCLKSIIEQEKEIDYEVIVIDNSSKDGSAKMVKKNFPSVILIENSKNHGFAAANNKGIAITKGRYVLLLNSDTIILNDAISKTVSFADNNPDAAVVGCKVLNEDGSLQPTCFMFPSVLNMLLSSTYMYKLFPKSRFFGREEIGWWDRDTVREVNVVTGCFMLVRREAIDTVGVMDERFFMYGEETDWCYRFKQAGWKMIFTPDAEIIHLGGRSTVQKSADMIVQLRLSILKFIRKHHGWLAYEIARFLTVLFFVVRLLFRTFLSLLLREKRKQSIIKMRAYLSGIGRVTFNQPYGIKKRQ